MGWKIAKEVHRAALAGVVSDRARLALDYMAWTCLDDPRAGEPAAEYWGGHPAITSAILGLDEIGTQAGRKATQRAIRELIDAGLIAQIDAGRGVLKARYRILVGDRWAPAKPVDNSLPGEAR